jgi:TonB family protein
MQQLLAILLLAAVQALPARTAEETAKAFAFVSQQIVMTVESAGPHSFVLNFVNLSDFVMVVQPNEFIYKGASGRFFIGQVFEKESRDNRGQVFKFSASMLLKSKSFAGLTVLGDFQELEGITELSVRIGAKRFYLEPLGRVEFELLAAKIGELEFAGDDPRAALEAAGLEPLGTTKSTDGTSDWDRDWQDLVRYDGVIVPKIIEKPPPAPTGEAIRTKTYGRVKLSAVVTRNGTLDDLRVEKGLGRGLDERALEAVQNSWIFLPATKNGEVLEGRLEFFVDFTAPAAPPESRQPGPNTPPPGTADRLRQTASGS